MLKAIDRKTNPVKIDRTKQWVTKKNNSKIYSGNNGKQSVSKNNRDSSGQSVTGGSPVSQTGWLGVDLVLSLLALIVHTFASLSPYFVRLLNWQPRYSTSRTLSIFWKKRANSAYVSNAQMATAQGGERLVEQVHISLRSDGWVKVFIQRIPVLLDGFKSLLLLLLAIERKPYWEIGLNTHYPIYWFHRMFLWRTCFILRVAFLFHETELCRLIKEESAL